MRIFCTFGCGQPNGGHVVPILCDVEASARAYMFDTYGPTWCTSYTEERWLANEQSKVVPAETRLPEVNVINRYLRGNTIGTYAFLRQDQEMQYIDRKDRKSIEEHIQKGYHAISPEEYFGWK